MLIFIPVNLEASHRLRLIPDFMRLRAFFYLFLAAALLTSCGTTPAADAARDRVSFVGLKNFSSFSKANGTNAEEIVLTSPEIKASINWDELIVSWNVPTGVHLKVEARAIYPGHNTKYYIMSMWSDDPDHFPRESVRRQGDDDGTIKTDTLVLNKITDKVQLRLTIGGMNTNTPLKFLGLSFCNSKVPAEALKPNRAAWGKTLEVPERRQGEYEGGGGWCSPTSLSMDLAYWSDKLHRPELNRTVPETAHAIDDGGWGGTGNWPFNTAYAGSYTGMRAYVTRLSDVAELEDWIAAGIPVIVSVSSYLTNDRTSGQDNGHLITCVGFDKNGDVVVNDPGVSVKRNVRARRIYAREKFVNAWKKSKNAVYLVYPDTATVPKDRFGHWDHGK
ncbi:MAG: hypothetical protein JWQ71_1172 [Pedosphaera sp.]|nr:hypothetical protein [Pedosphaera sp.]